MPLLLVLLLLRGRRAADPELSAAVSTLVGLKTLCSERSLVVPGEGDLVAGQIALTALFLKGEDADSIVPNLVENFEWSESFSRQLFSTLIVESRSVSENEFLELRSHPDQADIPVLREWLRHGMDDAQLFSDRYIMSAEAFTTVLEERLRCLRTLGMDADNAPPLPAILSRRKRRNSMVDDDDSDYSPAKKQVWIIAPGNEGQPDDRLVVLGWLRHYSHFQPPLDELWGALKNLGRGYPTRGFRSQLAFDQFVNRVIHVKNNGGWWDQIPMEDAAVMGPILAKTRRGGSIEPGSQALSEQEYQLYIDKRIEAEMRGEKSPRSSSARRDTQPEESPLYVY